MKIYKKIFISLGLFVFVIIGFAFSVPFLFKDKITVKIKETINKKLNAKVNFNEVDLSIISSFPDLRVDINNLMIIGIDSFKNDTLLHVKSLALDLNLTSVFKGESYQINDVKLDKANIYAKVLPSGEANWDIIKVDTLQIQTMDNTQSSFKASLKSYSLTNSRIIYDDLSLHFLMDLDSLNHSGTGDFTQDLFILETASIINSLTVKYGGIAYLNKVKVSGDIPLDIDLKQMKFSLADNTILLNNLVLSTYGSLALPNDSDMVIDFKFDAKQSALKNFLSLIPGVYASNFADMKADGKFAFNGFAKGIYNETSLPAFKINLSIADGTMSYKGLPASINNINVNARIENPDGVTDHTLVNIPSFKLAFDRAPISGRFMLKTPLSDPFVDFDLKGKLDLKQLTTIFPTKDMTLSGILDVDVNAKGNKSAVDKGNYDNFIANGQVIATNITYAGASVPMPVYISTAIMKISPRNIALDSFKAILGKSDFDASGTINNYLAYAFKKNQLLSGTFKLKSNLIDVNELMGPTHTATSTTDTTKLTLIKVPSNINFLTSVSANKILYHNYDISNARGELQIKDETAMFKDMSMQILDGTVNMNGSYSTVTNQKPKINLDFGIEKMSIQKAFGAFNTIMLFAPVAKYTNGLFSTNIKFVSEVGQDMMPIYSTINASGLTNIIQAVVNGFEPLIKVANALNVTELKNIELKDVLSKFLISNGQLIVAPFNIKKGDILLNIQGSNGLDQSLAYLMTINIPRAKLGKANDNTNAVLAILNKKIGSDIALSENVKVNAVFGGTITKPTLKLDLIGETKNGAKAIVNQLIDDKKTEFKAKVNEEVNKFKEQANEEITKKTDTIKKQAEQKAKDEIKNKLNNLFKKKEGNN
jgi:hypothetical protein